MLLAYIVVIRSDRRLRRYHLFGNWWRPEWPRFREIVRIGTPIGLIILAEAGLFTGAAFLMGRIGEEQLAGHTLALQIAALAFQVPFGVAQAATIRSEEHTSELQSLMRTSYAVFCLTKKKRSNNNVATR